MAEGRIHWFLGGGSDTAQQISEWVAQSFPATSAGGTTVYDLTA